MTRTRRRWAVALSALAAALLAILAWLVWTSWQAYAELTASRDDLLAAKQALGDSDVTGAGAAVASAADHARAGRSAIDGPLWSAAAAIPGLGSTPASVRTIATSLDEALSALAPSVHTLGGLDPRTLVGERGQVDLAALAAATEPLEVGRAGVDRARATLAQAPALDGASLIPGVVRDAARQLDSQLAELGSTLTTALTVSRIGPPLLGIDGPKRYFVGILNPNEARGVGGFLGTYAILRADQGRLTVEHVGSNSDLTNFTTVPVDLGADYTARYRDDPALVANMNISPHFPDAARLWLASWRAKTGEVLDGAFAADVVALGRLVSATGKPVALPDGGSMTGEQLTQFAISGIYERFPQPGDSPARKKYQEAVTSAAFTVVTGSASRREMAATLGDALTQRRLLLWSADEALEQALVDAGIAGSLRVPDGHTVDFVVINSSGSKLDAFLGRSVTYQVGRCPARSGRVESRVTLRLTNDIPEEPVPEYMISLAERGPTGPVNSTLAQLHLPNGAEITEVEVDGASVGYAPFAEQGRPSMALQLRLPPHQVRTMSVLFTEPADDGPASLPAQPLGSDPEVAVTDQGC